MQASKGYCGSFDWGCPFFTNATGKMLVTVLTGLLNPFLEWEDLPVWPFCFLVSGSDPEESKGLPKSCGIHPEGLFCSLLWFLNCLHSAELVMSWLQAQEAVDSLSPQRSDTPPSPRFRVKGTLLSSPPCLALSSGRHRMSIGRWF